MGNIDPGDWFNIVGGVLSIIAFVFSMWIWMRADFKQRELLGTIRTLHDVSGSILWEMQTMAAEDDATRLRQAERALGLASAMHTLSSKFVNNPGAPYATEFGSLVERGVIIPNSILWNIERSTGTKEVWLVTPDLEPDLSDSATGSLVNANLRSGKRYVYFYPSTLANSNDIKNRLMINIGASRSSRSRARVKFVPLDKGNYDMLSRPGNTILFFQGSPDEVSPHAFEEVVLIKIPRRGYFWQKHDIAVAQQIYRSLSAELRGLTPD